MTLGLTDGTQNAGTRGNSQTDGIYAKVNLYGANVGDSSEPHGTILTKTLGITTDSTKSGIETETSSSVNYVIKY